MFRRRRRGIDPVPGLLRYISELEQQLATARRIHESDERRIAWYRIKYVTCRRACRGIETASQAGTPGERAAA